MTLRERLEEHKLNGETFAAGRETHNNWDGQLTAMQDAVLADEHFWDTAKNLIIQGATSSGKTLLAEIAAYRQITDEKIWRKKVIFLVPLRALVTAQCNQIKRDFQNVTLNGKHLEIFESSADYQDHDAQIMMGDYDIAVIVYEKFFALLSSGQSRENNMLKNCGLVIVDELQMLSTKDRGPKMEFSIMRLLEMHRVKEEGDEEPEENIRIIGLTTSESGVEDLGAWMKANIVGNAIRPVPLRQYIVSYDTGKMMYKDIAGEGDPAKPDDANGNPDKVEEISLLAKFDSGNCDKDKKQRCLYSLLATWLEANKEKKILIFTNAKWNTREIANGIVRKFPQFEPPAAENAERRAELEEQFHRVLVEFSDEDGVNDLERLISKGVAFHHSGLPAIVRTMIEDDFRDENGHIQIVVCTETLMVGMNLPADIVILYDGTTYRGGKTPVPLSVQSYNNFVGRAGRLGMNSAPNYRGKSYLLTENLERDYSRYTADRKTAVKSSFRSGSPEVLAPYFLNWIGKEHTVEERIQSGLRINFCYHKEIWDEAVIKKDAEAILDQLKKAVPTPQKRLIIKRKNGSHILSNLGNALAPYALNLDTCKILIEYMLQKPISESDIRFLAPDDESSVCPPKPLIELILTICSCEEVDKSPAISVFGNESEVKALNRSLQDYLKQIYPKQQDEESQEDEWDCEDEDACKKLTRIAYSSYIAEPEELRQVVRTLILCLWLAGYRVRKIKEILRLNSAVFSTSDIERISEAAAYLVEAASKCQDVLLDSKDAPALYRLSIRMKYGIPHELHCLANTHVRGITRNQLLAIWRKAQQVHKTPRDYVMASFNPHHQALRKALQARERVNNYYQQIENIQEEDQSHICKELSSHLQNMDMHSGAGARGCRDAIRSILTAVSQRQGKGWSIMPAQDELEFTFMTENQQSYYLRFGLFDMGENSDEWFTQIRDFDCQPTRDRNQHPVNIAVLYGAPPAGEERLPPNLLVISSELLGVLLAKCVRDSAGADPVKLIYRILSDLQGSFILHGASFFRAYGPISDLIKGYLHTEPDKTKPGLLYYSGVADPGAGSPCAVVPWGDTGEEEKKLFKPIIAFYHPALLFSKTAKALLQECGTILCSEDDYETVKKDYGSKEITVIKNSDINDALEVVVKTIHQPAHVNYEFDFGISLRGRYLDKMNLLKEELEKFGKRVLLMEKDDFPQRIAGSGLIEALHREFSRCRHIVICDTIDYDQSPYTAMVELNVVMDKIFSALNTGCRYPIYRVRMPDVEPSHVLTCLFRDDDDTYSDGDVHGLAQRLVDKSEAVDKSNQSTP